MKDKNTIKVSIENSLIWNNYLCLIAYWSATKAKI